MTSFCTGRIISSVFSFSFFPSLLVQMSYLEIVSFASCTAVVLQVLLADWSIPDTYFRGLP